MEQLRSFVALSMHIMRYSLGHRLLCAVQMYELHHESHGCCCIVATLEQPHGYVIWAYVMAMPWLHYGYIVTAAKAAASARREETCLQFLQLLESPSSLSLCLAYPGFSRNCKTTGVTNRISDTTGTVSRTSSRQRTLRLSGQQDIQQVGEPKAPLDGGSQWPPYSMWYHVAETLSAWGLVKTERQCMVTR